MLIYYYRSEDQRQAMEFLHNEVSRLSIIVLPTSAGKSWLFYSAAALVDQQTVVVVVPFRELLKATIEDALKLGLSCQEWTNQESCRELCQLTIVSADRVCNDQFQHYLSNLDENGYLAHIFIDECHTALLDTNYRPNLRELYMLHYRRNCQITYLTATLMPQLTPSFQLALGFQDCSIFRRPTARPTIGYRVHNKGSGRLIPPTIAYIREHCQLDEKSGIIFVPSIAIGRELSSELGCLLFVASDTEEEKDRILESWTKSKGWIIATTALGQGLNFSTVLHVVHCGRPYTLSGALQQGGRGGRSGEISYHTIIEDVARTSPIKRELISKGSPKDIEETALTAFIQAVECRRVVLARYMDGFLGPGPTDCRSLEYMLCDKCESQARHELIEREHSMEHSMEYSMHSRRVENRPKSDLALRVEALYTLGSHAPSSRASHAFGSLGSHASGSYALGSLESHAPTPPPTNAFGTPLPGPPTIEFRGDFDISQSLYKIEQANDSLIKIMNRLRGECYYCLCFTLERGTNSKSWKKREHLWTSRLHGSLNREGGEFELWKRFLKFNKSQCRECGLPLSICRRLDRSTEGCDYPDIMLPILFIVQQRGQRNWLEAKIKELGFKGEFGDLKEWLAQEEVCFGKQWETNYMRIFRAVCDDICKIWGKD